MSTLSGILLRRIFYPLALLLSILVLPRPCLGEILDFSLRARWNGSHFIAFDVHTGGPSPSISGSTPVVFRVLGPSLELYANGPILQNPRVTLMDANNGHSYLMSNIDWGDRDGNGQTDSPAALAPFIERVANAGMVRFLANASKDCALAFDMAPGRYNHMIQGVAQATPGEFLLEFANANTSTDVDIVGVKLRKKFFNGDTDIYAFTLPKGPTRSVLIRARGPSLAALITNLPVLSDPIIGLYSGDTQIAYNDDWSAQSNWTAISSKITALGLDPYTYGSKDAVLLLNLAPGSYSLKLWGGKSGEQTDGECIVEVFIAN